MEIGPNATLEKFGITKPSGSGSTRPICKATAEKGELESQMSIDTSSNRMMEEAQ